MREVSILKLEKGLKTECKEIDQSFEIPHVRLLKKDIEKTYTEILWSFLAEVCSSFSTSLRGGVRAFYFRIDS